MESFNYQYPYVSSTFPEYFHKRHVQLGVDHLIFDGGGGGGGGCANPPKNIEHMFLVKKKILAEFLRRKKNRAAL